MKPIISVENLGKRYRIRQKVDNVPTNFREVLTDLPRKLLKGGVKTTAEDFWALKDVSFDILPGERVGIIGRNGTGKSTLLKLLSRITEPTAGKITMRGRVASLLEVGTGFHGELTGRENIYLNGAILGMTRMEVAKKFDEIVDFAGVEQFLDVPVKRYSSGMYVRLGFAVAAHLEPEILIVDEVLAVGDVEFRKKCLGKMQEVSRGEGRTVLFVSHEMSAIRALCSEVFWVQNCQCLARGPADAITAEYERGVFFPCDSSSGRVERKDKPRSPFYITATELRDMNGELQSEFVYGDKVDLRIVFEGTAPLDGFTIEYIWFDERGVRASFGASFPVCNTTYDRSTRVAVCRLGPLAFTSGRYRLYLSVRIWGLERWDEWEEAAFMRITLCDPYQTGQDIPGDVNGHFVIPQEWSVLNHNNNIK